MKRLMWRVSSVFVLVCLVAFVTLAEAAPKKSSKTSNVKRSSSTQKVSRQPIHDPNRTYKRRSRGSRTCCGGGR